MNYFKENLDFSHSAEDSAMWGKIYPAAFPGMQCMGNSRQDGQLQRFGIDRTIVLESGKAIYIDEKVRRKDYGDILLEYVSNDRTGALGWCEKPLLCDYIAYAVIPSSKCYLLPVTQLQLAWKKNKDAWLAAHKTRAAQNEGYKTLNCPLPIDVLYRAIGSALRISF